ncbi:MAG: type II toxin-antitoxin system VapC family toxin [Thermodesulfobacteriota bacterium]|nr:type II toxin-antitoxin system VapC family toxin [Thermodesulfobacteriota bacterium]
MMKLLLDTHILLWSLLDPARLAMEVSAELENSTNELWLSPISTWEMIILAERGRIVLDTEPVLWMRDVFKTIAFKEAPVNHEVAIQSRMIDLAQEDPADRFLVATAIVYDLTLVTADRRLIDSQACSILANNANLQTGSDET